MSLIIDVHGHYTTAPKALEEWRNKQIAGIKDPASMPKVSDLKISDDELRETIETNQLAKMKERGSDITIFSPRASFCLLYTSPSPRDYAASRMPSSA